MVFIPTPKPGEYPEGLTVQLVMGDVFFLQRLWDKDNPLGPGRQMQGAILPRLPGYWPRRIDGCPEDTEEILFMPGIKPIHELGPGSRQVTA